MAEAIVTPQLIDRTCQALQAASEHDRLLETAFDNSELAQRICNEMSAIEGEKTCAAILDLCKCMFVLGWQVAHKARQLAVGGGP